MPHTHNQPAQSNGIRVAMGLRHEIKVATVQPKSNCVVGWRPAGGLIETKQG